MKKITFFKLLSTLIITVIFSENLLAQSDSSEGVFSIAIIAIIGALILAVVFLAADNFMNSLTGQKGLEQRDAFFPALQKIRNPKPPEFVGDHADFKELKQGFDILLEGEAEANVLDNIQATRYAVQPANFRGIAPIPKMKVAVGDEVKAGDPVFFDKSNPDINYVAPVSGEIVEVNRGAKRAITEIVILADREMKFAELPTVDLTSISREDLVNHLQLVGFWPCIRQRPYDRVAETDVIPDNVFISTFDSAPLAPDLNFVVEGKKAEFDAGINTLTKLTSGKVHLGLSANKGKPNPIFTENDQTEKHWFKGPHPSGNVGIQIHHINSIGRGEKVWVLTVQDIILLGNIMLHKRFDTSRLVALTGETKNPAYVSTYLGANIGELLKDHDLEKQRIISGDILSGQKKTADHYLNTWDDQITVIEEGNEYEMFGWLLPSKQRPSVSKTYPNFLFKDLKYKPDTNTHGERRAFVVTDQYEKLLPMDIYPQHLMKAILANDFERMEGLGIYELSEEDVALCEFACTSKMPLQKILRQGLDLMEEQG